MARAAALEFVAFATELGWMALVADDAKIKRLLFGHPSRAATLAAIEAEGFHAAQPGNGWNEVVEKLQAYAVGERVDFRDVPLDLAHLTAFQRRVIKKCRAIAYGKTSSYGALAEACGSPGAARAVGNTMAANRFCLIVPCHRVISSDGGLGSYSGPDGVRAKRRLLDMECRTLGARQWQPAKPKSRKLKLASSRRAIRQRGA